VTLLLLTCGLLAFGPQEQHGGVDRRELAAYRLTTSILERFNDASERIAVVMERDPAFLSQPLFSQDIVRGGDVVEVSARLEQRLREHPDLSRALHAASITPRDYTKAVLTVVAARLALGFLESGVMRSIPPGAPTENVNFVRTHRAAVDDVLLRLGIELGRTGGRTGELTTGNWQRGTGNGERQRGNGEQRTQNRELYS
jgi:hypothetical protein